MRSSFQGRVWQSVGGCLCWWV